MAKTEKRQHNGQNRKETAQWPKQKRDSTMAKQKRDNTMAKTEKRQKDNDLQNTTKKSFISML
jgi:hypothetical protein